VIDSLIDDDHPLHHPDSGLGSSSDSNHSYATSPTQSEETSPPDPSNKDNEKEDERKKERRKSFDCGLFIIDLDLELILSAQSRDCKIVDCRRACSLASVECLLLERRQPSSKVFRRGALHLGDCHYLRHGIRFTPTVWFNVWRCRRVSHWKWHSRSSPDNHRPWRLDCSRSRHISSLSFLFSFWIIFE
jgi:hypothetical protein